MSTAQQPDRAAVSIDDDVELLTEQIQALKKLGAQPEVREGDRYDFSIRWGTALAGRLRRLVHYSALGMLTDADEGRFRSLRDELRGLSDVIDRFRLAQPVLTDTAPVTAKRHGAARLSSLRRGHFSRRP